MRSEQLEYLCEIAKRKSMNLASSKLYVSQQTLSTAIKNLEKELDTKLLERTYHGVFPTEIGQELIDISQDFLVQLGQLKLKIAAQNNTQLSGELKVAVEPGINLLIMPKITIHFYKFYPQTRCVITVLSRDAIKTAIANKEYDIGLVSNYTSREDSVEHAELFTKEIIEFQLMARVNRQSPLADETVISLRTLLNYPIALNTVTSGKDLVDTLKKHGKPYIMPTNYYGIAQQLVLENMAVSLSVKLNNYFPFYFNNFNGEIRDIPIKESFPFTASYIIHKENKESKIIERFIDSLIHIT